MIYLDTHVVVWLYAGELGRLPEGVKRTVSREELQVAPVVKLELQLLHEIGRIRVPGQVILGALESSLGLRACDLPLAEVINHAVRLAWTRDPFDRLIVAHALADGAGLVTKDRTIRAHFTQAVWDGA